MEKSAWFVNKVKEVKDSTINKVIVFIVLFILLSAAIITENKEDLNLIWGLVTFLLIGLGFLAVWRAWKISQIEKQEEEERKESLDIDLFFKNKAEKPILNLLSWHQAQVLSFQKHSPSLNDLGVDEILDGSFQWKSSYVFKLRMVDTEKEVLAIIPSCESQLQKLDKSLDYYPGLKFYLDNIENSICNGFAKVKSAAQQVVKKNYNLISDLEIKGAIEIGGNWSVDGNVFVINTLKAPVVEQGVLFFPSTLMSEMSHLVEEIFKKYGVKLMICNSSLTPAKTSKNLSF